jgi:hypothetical protein
LLVVLVIASALASGAGAESPDEPSSRWQPAFSVGFGVQNQGFETSLDSDPLVVDDPGPPPTYSGLGVSGSDSATVLAPLFRFDAALYTPVILVDAGAPRLFFDAGAQIPLSEGFSILRLNREYSQTRLPPGGNLSEFCPDFEVLPDGVIRGCDHAGAMDMNYDVIWYAGLGVEFTLPVSRRQFKLRPSVGYFGQSLQFDGTVSRVDRAGRPRLGFPDDPPEGTILRELSVSGSTDEIVHGLGPRLAIDAEVARVGAFSLNAFLEAQLFWILSDRDISFSGQSADVTADFDVKLRSLIAQGGGGLRIVWRGD